MRKLLIFFIPILVVLAGLGIVFISGNKERGAGDITINYAQLTKLARSIPPGEEFLQRIRDTEKLLYDSDKSNDADAYLGMALFIRQLGDSKTALTLYRAALTLRPEDLLGLHNLATVYKDLGKYDEAEKTYRKLIEVNPGDVTAYRNLADVYALQHQDRDEGVVQIVESGLGVVLEPADLLSYLGVYFRDKGNREKAIEYFEKLVLLYPDQKIYQVELEELKIR